MMAVPLAVDRHAGVRMGHDAGAANARPWAALPGHL